MLTKHLIFIFHSAAMLLTLHVKTVLLLLDCCNYVRLLLAALTKLLFYS